MRGVKTTFSGEQLRWLAEHYPDTPSAECARHCGCSLSTVIRKSRGMGLQKSREYLALCRRNAAAHAAIANRGEGNRGRVNLLKHGAKHRFRKGHDPRAGLTEEQWRDMHRRKGQSLHETWQRERRRALFGLEQRTNLRVSRQPRENAVMRYRMRKLGYVIPRGAMTVTIRPATRRCHRTEGRAARLGFRIETDGTGGRLP